MTDAPLRILRLCDARPGHEKQSLGFVQGLKAHLPVACRNVQLYDRPGGALDRAALKHASDTSRADPPDLIVGAGHRTHLPMLWLRARRGGRTVVLMKPTLPIGLFDLVLIPEHDAAPAGLNVLTTQGVLSPIVDPSRIETDDTDVPAAGLILVGGINRHYAWHSRRVARQIGQVLRAAPQLAWQVSDSRRTPEDFPRALAEESEVPL
ncbi:MAG: ELM1/GtrOC1 family putative glycosyltransferase, partial [Pseudomonadota bacterium]